jgi:uncharacterized membrane protein
MKLVLSLAFSLLLTSPALAVPYTFTPLPDGFTATALNGVGQIAGKVPCPISICLPTIPLPALYDRGTITLLDLPTEGSHGTIVTGINDAGDLVAEEHFSHGTGIFAVFDGVITGIAHPGNTPFNSVTGLNNLREIVGGADVFTPDDFSNIFHGYVSSGTTFTLLDVPGAGGTGANGINDAGQVVGSFALNPEPFGPLDQGFLFDAGTFTTLNKPGAAAISPVAINNAGLIAGTYTDATGGQHGFTEAAGVFTEITGLDGAAFLPVDLNNLGQLIGTFGGTGPSYLATPTEAVPEPATAVLLSAGLVAFGVLHRHRAARTLS